MFNGLPECAKGCMDGVVPGATAWPPRQSERRQLPKIRVPQSNWYFDPVPVVMFTTDGVGQTRDLCISCWHAEQHARRPGGQLLHDPFGDGRMDGAHFLCKTRGRSQTLKARNRRVLRGCCQRFGVLRVTVVTTQR